MLEFWVIVGTFLLAPFLVGPLLIYSTYRVFGRPEHTELDLDHPQTPAPFARYVAGVQRALYADGFNLVGCAVTAAEHPAERFVALLENPATHDLALATVLFHRGREVHASLAFVTDFADASSLQTDNGLVLHGCPGGGDVAHLQVVGIKDPRQLYHIHRARVQQATGPSGKTVSRARQADGSAAGCINTLFVRDLYDQLNKRYLYLDEESLTLYPTWKGALLTAWHELGLGGLVRTLVRWQRSRAFLTTPLPTPLPPAAAALHRRITLHMN